jgi:hypothetical protein
MKNIPDLPPAFALPQEFRQSLPAEVQEWLASVEKRIDGMTLDRIQEEAEDLIGQVDSPESQKLYQLGRRIFYTRMQQITELALPGQGTEIGVNLLWEQTINTLPGGAVTNALIDREEQETLHEMGLKKMGPTRG